MKKINCIIVDDEALARQGLQEYVADIEFLQLVAVAENPLEAAKILAEQPIDLMFLDIEMPKMTGIDFLKIAKNIPKTILTTAYSEYALEAFELNIIDYLLKPISFERFEKACLKAKELIDKQDISTEKGTYFFVKSDKKYEKILLDEVLFFSALQNYVTIHLINNRKIVTHISLKEVEQNLNTEKFVQVHKSYIVALDKITSLDRENLFIDKQNIPIGRTYSDQLFQKIVADKLLKK